MNDATVEQIARVAHEVNRAYCRALGDYSQLEWDEAPQWQRDSAINGVRYHIDNPGSSPADSHNNWLKEKRAEGWVYGDVKNPDKKEHPCMMPYGDLPLTQRVKDYLFIGVVRSMTAIYS